MMSTVITGDPRRILRRGYHLFSALLLLTLPGLLSAQDFVSPTRIAHGPSGQILVSDGSREVVVSWKPGGKKGAKTISVPGRPAGVAYGWNMYFVGNEITHTIDVISKKGKLLYTLGNNYRIKRSVDIAVDIDQELVFVTDPVNGQVVVFHANGAFLNTFPAAGQVPLYKPTGIAVDPVRGEVLVSDFGFDGEATVNIYDYAGYLQAQIFGNAGCGWFSCNTGPGNFSRPQGLAVNEQGHIYLVDSLRGQVLVFDRDTQQSLAVIGALGTDGGQLMLPLDVLIEPQSKDLYVTNNRNRRIEVFSGKGLLP